MSVPYWQDDYEDKRFVQAVVKILRHEGFFSDDPVDPGGPTKYGISLRWLRTLGEEGDFDGDGDVDRDDIWAMEEGEAVRLYYKEWYLKEGYGDMILIIGGKIFDLAVNMGPKPANRILQRAVRAGDGIILKEDGIIGKKTLAAVGRTSDLKLLPAIRSEAAGHYRLLIERRESFERYRDGWMNRAYS